MSNYLLLSMLKQVNLSYLEGIALAVVAIIVVTAVISSNLDVQWFENVFAVEDGVVENWTVVPILIASIHAFITLLKMRNVKSKLFKATMIFIILFSLFVAGEEISWGQRIFEIQSSSFFKQNNSQGETNLHNMVIGDTKVNKLIFSQILTVAVAIYLLIFPILYRGISSLSLKLDEAGVPIPKTYQIVSCILLFVAISLIPSGKNAEILEAGITTIFLLIFMYPQNKSAFLKPSNGNPYAHSANLREPSLVSDPLSTKVVLKEVEEKPL